MGHGVAESRSPIVALVGITAIGCHPDFVAANLDPGCGHVVGPQIEGPAAFEIEAGVVPVAGEDAVFYGPTMERKTEMRASVVQSPYPALLI